MDWCISKVLTNLRTLQIDFNQITDVGLVHLNGLTNLQTLELDFTQFTDAGPAQFRWGFHRTRATESDSKLASALLPVICGNRSRASRFEESFVLGGLTHADGTAVARAAVNRSQSLADFDGVRGISCS